MSKAMDRYRSKKSLKCLTPHRIGILMISLVVIWGTYLLMQMQLSRRGMRESDYLKTEIVKLSREYIHALAKEKNKKDIGATSNQQTAVLLDNMLDRIEGLEDQLRDIIVNSTSTFSKMGKDIQTLNITIHIELNKTVSASSGGNQYTCVVPNDPSYPNCADKVKWLQENWKSPKFRNSGVNGTVCSFLAYLSETEDECPQVYPIVYNYFTNPETKYKEIKKVKNLAAAIEVTSETEELKCLKGQHDAAYPECDKKIQWMKKYWKSDPKFSEFGVDGTICSIVKYLSEIESFCPAMNGRSVEQVESSANCAIPSDPKYPDCAKKVLWLKRFWRTDPCYKKLGVNGTVCSFVSYLGEVESFCPVLPGHKRLGFDMPSENPNILPSLSQTSLSGMLDVLTRQQTPMKVQWMAERMKRLWPDWLAGFHKLRARVKLDSYGRKKILIYIGLLADEGSFHFAEQASKGGPLGELVQWSDLIAALYLLGHDVSISLSKTGSLPSALTNILKGSSLGLCPSKKPVGFDIIYTDYIGLRHMAKKFKNIKSLKCKIRLVDSFGTEAEYNHRTNEKRARNTYGYNELNLKQYNTMFPHSPDNTFLGFIVENHAMDIVKPIQKKPIALVYGKHISMWKDRKKIAFLGIVQQYFEVHATVGGKMKPGDSYVLPRYVKNHGVLKGVEFQKLLREATVYVGLGFPYEGPAALEAIANGCFFFNVKLVPPLGRGNNDFFKQKPTNRRLTSQHPYAERFIGAPYVYTVNVNDEQAVREAMQDMKDKTIKPYLPFEFTYEGMLERLYALTKHQNFCYSHTVTWPVLSSKQVFTGEINQGCDEVCSQRDLICEPAYFPHINAVDNLPTDCKTIVSKAALVAPAIMSPASGECIVQTDTLLYSCTAKSPSVKRICPCRDFVKGQTALCKDCLD